MKRWTKRTAGIICLLLILVGCGDSGSEDGSSEQGVAVADGNYVGQLGFEFGIGGPGLTAAGRVSEGTESDIEIVLRDPDDNQVVVSPALRANFTDEAVSVNCDDRLSDVEQTVYNFIIIEQQIEIHHDDATGNPYTVSGEGCVSETNGDAGGELEIEADLTAAGGRGGSLRLTD